MHSQLRDIFVVKENRCVSSREYGWILNYTSQELEAIKTTPGRIQICRTSKLGKKQSKVLTRTVDFVHKKKSVKGLPCFHTAIEIRFSTYQSTYSLTVIMVLFVIKCNIFSQESIMSTIEGQYLMSEYRQFSQAGEKIADMVYCESRYYLCLLQSQRLAQVSYMW